MKQGFIYNTRVKPVLSGHPQKRQKMGFMTENRLVLQNAPREHSAIFIKLPSVLKIWFSIFLSGRLRQVLLYMKCDCIILTEVYIYTEKILYLEAFLLYK